MVGSVDRYFKGPNAQEQQADANLSQSLIARACPTRMEAYFLRLVVIARGAHSGSHAKDEGADMVGTFGGRKPGGVQL